MTLAEKIRAAANQALYSEEEAYATLEYILRDRQLPAWLQRVAEDVDSHAVTDRHIKPNGDNQ
jgi:hypothetical protein